MSWGPGGRRAPPWRRVPACPPSLTGPGASDAGCARRQGRLAFPWPSRCLSSHCPRQACSSREREKWREWSRSSRGSHGRAPRTEPRAPGSGRSAARAALLELHRDPGVPCSPRGTAEPPRLREASFFPAVTRLIRGEAGRGQGRRRRPGARRRPLGGRWPPPGAALPPGRPLCGSTPPLGGGRPCARPRAPWPSILVLAAIPRFCPLPPTPGPGA